MKIHAQKDLLTYGIQSVYRAVSAKNPMPILSGILLRAANGTLSFSATDLELGIECQVPVQIEEEGGVVLPARYLSEIFRRLPDEIISIEVNKENFNATMTYGKANFNLLGLAPDEFPLLPSLTDSLSLEIKQERFKKMIKQVVFAASNDDNRPIFTGVLLEQKENTLRMIATDTHRLAYKEELIPEGDQEINNSIIIPNRALSELSRLLGENDTLHLSVGGNQISFEIPGIRLVSRLIEGQFPNYRQVIPQGCKTKVKVITKDFLEATERASLLAREGSNIIKIDLNDNTMKITSNNPEVGKIEEQLMADIEGEETQIAFNSKYLIDVLKVVDAGEIYLELTGSLSPGIVKPVQDDPYFYLILPIRIV